MSRLLGQTFQEETKFVSKALNYGESPSGWCYPREWVRPRSAKRKQEQRRHIHTSISFTATAPRPPSDSGKVLNATDGLSQPPPAVYQLMKLEKSESIKARRESDTVTLFNLLSTFILSTRRGASLYHGQSTRPQLSSNQSFPASTTCAPPNSCWTR